MTAERDRAAFEELYRRTEKKFEYFFYKTLGGDLDSARDLTHDLFVKLYHNADKFDPTRRFSPWAYRIAYNLCMNELKKRKRNGDFDFEKIEAPANGDRDFDRNLFKERLNEEIERLSPNQRAVFMLKYRDELPLADIAEIVGKPLGTVKSRLHYCLKNLSEKLKEFNPKGIEK